MKNRLGMLLPDTLHVSPEEASNCAVEINNHLERADHVQHIQKISNPEFPESSEDYHHMIETDTLPELSECHNEESEATAMS